MVKLYAHTKYIRKAKNGVMNPDYEFLRNWTRVKFTEDELNYIRKYEHAPSYSGGATLIGRLGPFHIENMSSGTKTLLLLSLYYRKALPAPDFLSISECGTNILDTVFDLAEQNNNSIPLLLLHSDTHKCQRRDYIVNDDPDLTATSPHVLSTHLIEGSE